MNSKGQSALEYLLTYGWALVVIVIVVAALFAFGVFNPPSNCSPFSGRILLKDYAITGTGITLSVANGGPGAMSTISAGGDLGAGTVGTDPLAVGAQTTVTYTGSPAAGTTYDMNVTYTTSSIVHTETSKCFVGSV